MSREACRTALTIVIALHLAASVQAQATKTTAKDVNEAAVRRWALLIGVDRYTELGKLRFAGADQRALAEQLIASGFTKDQVFLLHDKAAEPKYLPFRENIEKQLNLVLGLADAGDLVIVGFSGHGVQLDGKSYLCPLDTRLDKLAATMIPLEGVYERMARCKATLKLLFVDACRNDFVPAGRRSVVLTRSLGEFAVSKEKPPEGIALLASCGPGQVSVEDEEFKHGVFMHYLLEGLRGKAANAAGTVSLVGLYDYASLETKKYVARKFNEYQTPALDCKISGPFEICSLVVTRPVLPSSGSVMPAEKATPPPGSSAAKMVTNSIGMKLVLIPAGDFLMGSGESAEEMAAYFNSAYSTDLKAEDYKGEHPQHRVRITRPFYLGAHHVTVGQFRQFVDDGGYQTDAEKGAGTQGKGAVGYDAGTRKFGFQAGYSWRNPGFEQTDEHPVVCVSWNDAVAFCGWLSGKEGRTYRLPTEAEWEYACRAGTTTRYWCGDDPEKLAEVANVSDAAAKAKFPNWKGSIRASDGYAFTSPVGSFRANPFGLYDIHGNAWQWCADWYNTAYYQHSPIADPIGPDSGMSRVLRGGSWDLWPISSRCSERFAVSPDRYVDIGFRVARTWHDGPR
jgi:formylglycine-generating enzyme